jgi:hypothetical protein
MRFQRKIVAQIGANIPSVRNFPFHRNHFPIQTRIQRKEEKFRETRKKVSHDLPVSVFPEAKKCLQAMEKRR